MSKSQNTSDESTKDVFIANSIYPDLEGLLGFQAETLESIKDSCLIVVDTNALLLPYGAGKKGILKSIGDVYKKLIKKEQLVIPGQVVREFAKNRAKRLEELFQQISRKSDFSNINRDNYSLLEDIEEYKKIVKLEEEIDSKIKEYRETIKGLKKHIKSWNWNDPVSMLYSEMFKGSVIFDPKFEHEEILKDLDRRHIHKIPPGYKDSGNETQGLGDLLIWHTILKLGQQQKKSVVFISGDEKPDWYHRSENQALYPRYELVDEFRRNSDGHSFHMISLSELLDLFGASSDVVEEIIHQEAQERFIQGSFSKYVPIEAHLSEQVVYNWLMRRYPNADISLTGEMGKYGHGADMIIKDINEGIIGVQVKFLKSRKQSPRKMLLNVLENFYQFTADSGFDKSLLVLLFENYEDAITQNSIAQGILPSPRFPSFEIVVGYITGFGNFKVV